MDTSEILAKIRDFFRGVQATLGYIWSTRKILVISVFILLSTGLVVWARFGFTVQYSRFFASEIEDGCTAAFPKKTHKFDSIKEDDSTIFNFFYADVCENNLGQVDLYPTEFPQCLVVGYNKNRYQEWLDNSLDYGNTYIIPGGEGRTAFSISNLPGVPNLKEPPGLPAFEDTGVLGPLPGPWDPLGLQRAPTDRLGVFGIDAHHQYLVAEVMVLYNNCTWDASIKAAYPGSYDSAVSDESWTRFFEARGNVDISEVELDVPADASFGTDPTDLQTVVFPSCTTVSDSKQCGGIGFEVELDTQLVTCGQVAAETAFEHQTPEGLKYSWFSIDGEALSLDGIPQQPPARTFPGAGSTGSSVTPSGATQGGGGNRTAVPRSSTGEGSISYTARLSDHLLAVVHREPGQNPSDIEGVNPELIKEGKRINVFSYLASCTGDPGEKRPATRGVASEIPGITCSIEAGATLCSGNDIVQSYESTQSLPACQNTILTTCLNGCGIRSAINSQGEAVCKSADGTIPAAPGTGTGGGSGGGGATGGGNTGTASCEEIEFCPAGTVGLGAARNGAEFVDDSNLGWFDFSGGSLTLVCGPGLGGQAGTVYVGPPPPRQCPDGRTIPNSGDFKTLRATNISDFCFGNAQAAFDLNFLNPTHVINCAQHEPGYSETYDLPQGQWFFGAIGPGTATAAACVPGSSGGSSGGQTCDGDGSSCPDPSGTPQAANVSVTCGATSNTITWQNPQSLGAVVNSVQRSQNGGSNEFVFAEGGCYTSFGTSTYTDTNVSAGNTYTYRVKTGANVASNTVTCPADGASPAPTSAPTPLPTATQTSGPGSGPVCGDRTCNSGESCSSCADDCGTCGSTCGDGVCASNESCSSCSNDCGTCSATCGDGVCAGGESASSCADDCGSPGATCGDGVCDNSESCSSCSNDCGTCGSSAPIGTAGQTPTGPAAATLLAFMLASVTALLYVSYTHTSLFRRREVRDIEQERDGMDFRI